MSVWFINVIELPRNAHSLETLDELSANVLERVRLEYTNAKQTS